ncbi:MAG: class II aldolase/adducin family protein [Candidatus Kapaibacteriales bacterium]
MSEGIIKFSYEFVSKRIPSQKITEELNKIRQKFWEMKLVGVGENGISYGNISQRLSNNSFLITASQVGFKKILVESDYVVIQKADIKLNRVWVKGIKPPSSESLTHYAVYLANPLAFFVIHFHHRNLWKRLAGKAPTTSFNADFGTKELASSIFESIINLEPRERGLVVLGGHKDGLIAYSSNAEGLLELVIKYLEDEK